MPHFPMIDDLLAFLESLAPPALAEEWDNVGLLLGDRRAPVRSVMTCLTLTPDVAAEAVAAGCGLIVAHHPILFRPVQRLTGDSPEGAMLLELARAQIAVYSPHTGYDSAAGGVNAQLAELFDLKNVQPLRPATTGQADAANDAPSAGGGRCGDLPAPVALRELLASVKSRLSVARLPFVGDEGVPVARVGIACGAAAEFLPDAARAGCQALITGEARFHACLEARERGVALILAGHYATERPAMERLAEILARRFPDLSVTASAAERDPILWS
jgi:dinuclear metal center YbgI/SA1388 family protein